MAEVAEQTETTDDEQTTEPVEPEPVDPDTADEPLDETGRRALKKANEEAKNFRLKLKETTEELERLREDAMSEQEKAITQARKEGAAEALAQANERIARSEARALATGKTRDPEVAVQLLGDLTRFVTESGDVDADAMSAALDELVKKKEYLAVGDRQPVPGADQGARGGNGVSQLTREQLKTMTPEQIMKAEQDGRMDKLLGRS